MTPRQIIAVGFAAVMVAVIVVDMVARRRGGEPKPLGTTVTAAQRRPLGRALVFALWLWLGWHFLAR